MESERQEIQNILQNVQIQINRNKDRITVLDETIQDYYAPPTFGEFIEDLTVSLIKDIASSYASELVSSFSDNIKKHLKNYDLPTELENQLQNLVDKHLNVLECSKGNDTQTDFCAEYNDLATKIQDATDKAKSEVDDLLLKSLISTVTNTDNDAFDEMKDYLKDSGKQIGKDFWDVMNGEYESDSYSRSIIVDELERSILDTAQKQLALNYMENLYKLSQIDNEITIEQKEIEKYELNKMLMYKQQQDISFVKNFCKNSNGEGEIDCLEGYERSYLYKNALSYASYLLDKLPKDYLEIVKHFEYENLPFNVTSGTNILKDFIQIEQNITLANYNAISLTVAELQSTVSQSLEQKLHGSFYYRFYPQNLKLPTVEYSKLFNSITNQNLYQNLYQNEYLYIPIQITNEMLKRIQGLNNKAMYQIEDIQIGVNGISSVYVCGLNATIIKADDVDSFYLDDTIENGRVKKQIIQFPLTNKVKINDSFELKTIIKHQEIETNCVNTHNCNTNQTNCITNLQTKTIDNIVNVVSDRFVNRSIVGTWYIIIPKYNSNIDINPSIESFDIKFFVKGVKSNININGYCGNQSVENSEQCEGNQTIDCMDLSNNYTPGNSAKCNPWTCSWDTSECTVTSCNRIKDENGNYIENPYKECDEISETTTCSSLNSEYATGITICNPKTCRFDRNICPQELIIEPNSTQIYIFPNIFKYLNQLRNNKYRTEQTAKSYMHSSVYTSGYRQSFYCGCSYDETKTVDINNCGYTPVSSYQTYATKIEWEHSLPASLMGQTFDEYVNHENYKECNGSQKPDGTYYPVLSGRECAQSLNVEYKFMTADMYNLYPAIGQLNRLRSDKMYSEIEGENSPFGSCDFEYNSTNAEPRNEIKGDIARNYFYMYAAYPGRILLTASQWAMFLKWNHEDPISYEECSRVRRVQGIQQNVNRILDEACSTIFGL